MEPASEPSFYLTRKGALSGPFELDVLQRLVSAGEIAPDDQVRAEGSRDWVRAADHAALVAQFASRAELLAKLAAKPAGRKVTLPPPQAPKLPKPGEIVAGKYRIESRLGQGGMGEVHAAENVTTRKKVALKWLRPDLLTDEEAKRRFTNEARLAARIAHPNVIDIYDVVEEDGPFLVMELLEGEPLSSLLARRALPRVDLLRVLLLAMDGVAAAHKKGVVHRDLKPENVFVCTDASGRPVTPKVLDFGISKAIAKERGDSALTQVGALLGTPYYVPPEQLGHARHVDHRADVYALGVMLYECLTGTLPYESRDLSKLLAMIAAGEAPSARERDPSISEALSSVVQKAMARRPDDRFASVDALQLALAPLIDETRMSGALSPLPSAPPPVDERPSLEPTLRYQRAVRTMGRGVARAALLGITLGLVSLGALVWLLSGSAEKAPAAASTPGSGVGVTAAAPAPAPDARPVASRAVATPAAPARGAAPPPAAQAVITGAAAVSAQGATANALAELRRVSRRCGQGEAPRTSVELHIDALGHLSSLRAREVELATATCLERLAGALAFGETPAPRVLSLVLPLAGGKSTSEPPQAPVAPLAPGPAPPLVNPYHR